MTRAARTTALALALASSARGVAAQPLCAERAVSAEIDAALRDRVAGRGLAGYDRLVALHARCPSPRTLAQLALAEQSVRRWRDAYLHLAEALGQTRDPWIRDRRAPLETALHEIEERLPRLAPESNVPGAVLWVNGVEVGALPLAVPHVVTDASVALELRAAGYAPTRRVVTPVAGEVYRAMLAMEPASPSRSTVAEAEPRPFAAPTSPSWIAPRTTAAPSPSSAGNSPARVLAWVTAGAAVVGLAVGAAGLTLQRARAADFRTGYTEEACIATPSCDAARTQVHDAAVVAWAGLLAGTGLAVTAAVLFAVSRGEARPARAALGCAPTLHLAGGQCALSF